LRSTELIDLKTERQAMHLLLFAPMFASDAMVAPSGAAVIVILTIVAVLRSR